ncbi:MAG: hypothetical protein JOZ58_24455 [Acetobacteraceae bacterium]|nr:hypothetical protein [Acetobacteraceae bacterium]
MARVMMLLAQGPGKPEGDIHEGIDMRACLNSQGQVDVAAYEADPLPWRVRRFWPGREDWFGHLIMLDDGQWGLLSESGDNAPVWNISGRTFRPGEYVTLRRPDHEELIFRIVNVEHD